VKRGIDRLWVFSILFINGWFMALPVMPANSQVLPFWLTPIQVVHGVFLHELLFAIYVFGWLVAEGSSLPTAQHDARRIGLLVLGLGCLGVFSNVINAQPVWEMGEAGRLFLLAAFFLFSILWADRHGPTVVLRTFLLGIACAGVVTLRYSYAIRFMELSGLPFLLGQNGPGGTLGLSVVLSAWLFLERRSRLDAAIALSSCAVGLLGASISFSKLSMLMALFGSIAWVTVLWQSLRRRRSRKAVVFAMVLVFAFGWFTQDRITRYVWGVGTFIDYKFSGVLAGGNRSVESRSQYFLVVWEILADSPLFGVGYAGFYDAATVTRSYRSLRAAPEDAEAGRLGQSNPHSSFLYYAAANGLLGALLTLLLFIVTLKAIGRRLVAGGTHGKIVLSCIIVSYLIFAFTLPTLFNTVVMYFPAAIGIALSERARSRPSLWDVRIRRRHRKTGALRAPPRVAPAGDPGPSRLGQIGPTNRGL